jgi:hypothetical protein
VKDSDKPVILPAAQKLVTMGFKLVATGGTAKFLADQGVAVEHVNKVAEGRPHIVDKIVDGDIALIFNTTEGWQSLKDRSRSVRSRSPPGCPPSPRRRPVSRLWMQSRLFLRRNLKFVRSSPIIVDRSRPPHTSDRP